MVKKTGVVFGIGVIKRRGKVDGAKKKTLQHGRGRPQKGERKRTDPDQGKVREQKVRSEGFLVAGDGEISS